MWTSNYCAHCVLWRNATVIEGALPTGSQALPDDCGALLGNQNSVACDLSRSRRRRPEITALVAEWGKQRGAVTSASFPEVPPHSIALPHQLSQLHLLCWWSTTISPRASCFVVCYYIFAPILLSALQNINQHSSISSHDTSSLADNSDRPFWNIGYTDVVWNHYRPSC